MSATAIATDVVAVVDRYIDAWNETDPAARRALIAQTWMPDGRYLDPLMAGEGHEGIDGMIAEVHRQSPGFRFRRTGEVDAHHDVLRFTWALGPEGGEPFAGGLDVGVLAGDRLRSITGFLDFVPGGSEE